jgi:hypothetical protein
MSKVASPFQSLQVERWGGLLWGLPRPCCPLSPIIAPLLLGTYASRFSLILDHHKIVTKGGLVPGRPQPPSLDGLLGCRREGRADGKVIPSPLGS